MGTVAPTDRELFTVDRVNVSNAARLIPSRFDQSPVLEALVGQDARRLDSVYELDSLTNPRHTGTRACQSIPGFLLPENPYLHSHIVNGAFVHGGPHGRFGSDTCGTWYSSDTVQTGQAEVEHHKLLEYVDLDPSTMARHWPQQIAYTQWDATYTARLHTLDPAHPDAALLLDPDDYRPAQRAARELRESSALGVIYPSVRSPGGTCHAIFQPSVVQGVMRAAHWLLTITNLNGKGTWTRIRE